MSSTTSQNSGPRGNGVPAWHPILESGLTQLVPDNRHLVKLQAIPGMGAGLVAIVDIARGTRVLADTAILYLSPGERAEEIVEFCERIQDLTPEAVTKLEYLYGCPCHESDLSGAEREKLRDWVSQHVTNDEGQALQGAELEAAIKKATARWVKYATNCVDLSKEATIHGSGVYPMYSCMNHSCVPNTYYAENPSLGRLTVYTTRNIKAGEQLTTYYGPGVYSSLRSKQDFLSLWGFQCKCVACTDPGWQATERRAQEVFDELRGYEMSNVERFPERRNREATELLQRLVGLCKEVNMTMEVKRAYRDLSKLAAAAKDFPAALEYAQKELEIETTCIGTETEFLRENSKGAKYWIEDLKAKKEEFDVIEETRRFFFDLAPHSW